MDEKDSGRYRYESYPPPPPASSSMKQQNNNGTNSLKRNEPSTTTTPTSLKNATINIKNSNGKSGVRNRVEHNTKRCCCCSCVGPKAASFWVSLLTNLGICTLLFGYTLLGSFIFLAIEGGASTMHQRTLASTNRQLIRSQPTLLAARLDNITISPETVNDAFEARQRTVENIWDLTFQLNILYRENWTRLAALEIERFQDHLIKKLTDDMTAQLESINSPSTGAVMIPPYTSTIQDHDWTFARAFLYSLTVLTTIGYGNIAPRTTLGRIVTLAYAILGIPLTIVYLSSTGGVLARVARGVFSRALCCCLCSNCGYCCYDEKRMAEKERRMKRKRQQEELRSQQIALQEPYYVRSNSLHNNLHSPEKQIQFQISEIDSISASESRTSSMHGLSLLAPIILCFTMMIIYIVIGALVLCKLEEWSFLDGVYYCFMSLSTIGSGDLVPGLRSKDSTITIWFCSIYIMSGMALTAMCFNVLHQEIVHRIKHVVDIKKNVIAAAAAAAVTSNTHTTTTTSQSPEDPNDYLGS